MNRLLLISIFCISSISLYAQKAAYLDYSWEDSPQIHEVNPDEESAPAVIIKHFKILEQQVVTNQPVFYSTEHKIIHVNTDAGIEKFNKIYIPLTRSKRLISLKVRAISPTGKITEIQRENIKELKNVNGIANVKIFAIEGLETGGEAEYIYTLKSGFQPFGREVVQKDVPVRESEIILVYPTKWDYMTKSYNNLPKAKEIDFDRKRVGYSLIANNIPAAIEEPHSAYRADLMKFDYKITSNGYVHDLFTWKSLSGKLVENLSVKRGMKAGRKIIKGLNLENLSTEDKIRALESKIKSTITIQQGSNPGLSDPLQIITNGVGNERGLARLYIYSLDALNIPNQVVFCSNRYNGAIHPGFPSVTDISDLMIYFKVFDKYLVPGANHMRYGAPLQNTNSTTGLFVNYGIEFDNLRFYSHRFNQINPLTEESNHMGVKAVVDLQNSILLPEINQENYTQGYRAYLGRGAYFYSEGLDREDFLKQVTLSGFDNTNIIERTIEGDNLDLSSDIEEYFTIHTRYTTPELVEKIGQDYLIEIGKIIGKQSELYQEKERKSNIAFHSMSNYLHEITLRIPQGYKLTGVEKIKIDNRLKIDNTDTMYFISDYSLDEDNLTITVKEVYKILNLPVNRYDDFRMVINSAADFNKLTLVLTPDQD